MKFEYDYNGSYRDATGYYFTKWFDEPFTIDALNRTRCCGREYHRATEAENKFRHWDYWFEEGGVRYGVDCKVYTHNFEYPDSDDPKRRRCADAFGMGEHAYAATGVAYVSFVRRGSIYIVRHADVMALKPLWTRESKGQNGRKQVMRHFDVEDAARIPGTYVQRLPEEMGKCYSDAYSEYVRARRAVAADPGRAPVEIETMRLALVPIAERFNGIYDEVPPVDVDENLSDALALAGI